MDFYDELVIKASVNRIKNKPTPLPDENFDLKKFFLRAKDQKLENLVYPFILENKEIFKEKEVYKYWEKFYALSSISLLKLAEDTEAILKELEERKIPVILLKGAVIKDFYPRVEYRTMGDVDLIVKAEDQNKVVEVFKNKGYETLYTNKNIAFIKPGEYKFEVSFNDDDINYPWEKTVAFKNYSCIFKLKDTDFFIHFINHLIKHIKYKGAGIRNLIDIYLISKNTRIDYERVFSEFYKENKIKILKVILKCTEMIFDEKNVSWQTEEITENDAEELLIYMAENGVYGISEEKNMFFEGDVNKDIKRSTRILGFMKKIFPVGSKLDDRYSYGRKYVFLLPVAWVHRLFYMKFIKKKKIIENISLMAEASRLGERQKFIKEKYNL